jgi:hypothetical protein
MRSKTSDPEIKKNADKTIRYSDALSLNRCSIRSMSPGYLYFVGICAELQSPQGQEADAQRTQPWRVDQAAKADVQMSFAQGKTRASPNLIDGGSYWR